MKGIYLKSKTKVNPKDSCIKNCLCTMRENDDNYLFSDDEFGNLVVKLDGYAIIPIEIYNKLKK